MMVPLTASIGALAATAWICSSAADGVPSPDSIGRPKCGRKMGVKDIGGRLFALLVASNFTRAA
jgi:hypothetical protein